MLKYIGIDLGQKGAVCVQSHLGGSKPKIEIFSFWSRFGGTRLRTILDSELFDLFDSIIRNSGETFVAIEHPMMIPRNGKKAVSSMFEKFGLTKGILLGLGVETIWQPKPNQWKAITKTPGSDKSKMVRFANSITRAPGLTTETADAVLISEACRLYYR